MLTLFWWIPALITSFFQAGYQTANQFFKLSGSVAVFWRGLGPFVLLLPVPFILPWPNDPIFYLSVLVASTMAVYVDAIFFNSAAKWGGGIVTRLTSLTPIVSFFVWFLFRPNLIGTYLDQPGISLALLSIIIAVAVILFMLRKCEINRSAILYMVPALVASALISLFNKNAMDHSPLLSGVVYYIWLQGGIIALLSFIFVSYRGGGIRQAVEKIALKGTVRYGLTLALFLIAYLGFKSFSYTLVEHPTYITVVQRSSALWVVLFYGLIGHKEKGNVWLGLVLVALAALFIGVESQLDY